MNIIDTHRIRRRTLPFDTPFEALTLGAPLPQTVKFAKLFTEWAGITPDNISVHPICAVPIPTKNIRTLNPSPETAWHPLFWLPERLLQPTDGEQQLEHMTRVSTELDFSSPFHDQGHDWILVWDTHNIPAVAYDTDSDGNLITPETDYDITGMRLVQLADENDRNLLPIYDPTDHSWLDVPYLVGIDTTTIDGANRMRSWLAGAPDPALDLINLDDVLVTSNRPRDWAERYLSRVLDARNITANIPDMTLMQALIEASFALAAYDIFNQCAQDINQVETGDTSVEAVRSFWEGFARNASHVFPTADSNSSMGRFLASSEHSLLSSSTPHEACSALKDIQIAMSVIYDVFTPGLEAARTHIAINERDIDASVAQILHTTDTMTTIGNDTEKENIHG